MSIIAWEAQCRKCGEIFNPSLPDEGADTVEHEYSGERDEPCGGTGDVLGCWGTRNVYQEREREA